MEGLKGLDDVAYVRFASVYKNFREASDFKALLGTLSDPATAPAATGTGAPRGEGETSTEEPAEDLSATVTPLRPKRQPKSRA
jgi:transcriptional repressor NrdR